MLRLVEIFNSIQGEGTHSGLPCAFVRLAACNLRCGYCDTPYSFGKGEKRSIESVLQEVGAFGVRHVCITGGEPMLQLARASIGLERLAGRAGGSSWQDRLETPKEPEAPRVV